MTLRWRSGVWKHKVLVQPRDETAVAVELSSIEQREGV
jgi:hypothetical protein